MQQGSSYDEGFYEGMTSGAASSAGAIVPLVHGLIGPHSVADVGCGLGAWLRAWQDAGVTDLLGIDGPHVDRADLLVPAEHFKARDLSSPGMLDRDFDLVQSLEVAEHLPTAVSPAFVDLLTGRTDVVLFSAAVPGQGGTQHINEQPLSFWRGLFRERGFVAVDVVRPAVAGRRDVRPWYRYNTILYVREARLGEWPDLREAVVADGVPLPEVAPPLYRLRRALLSPLPPAVIDTLARAKILLKDRLSGRLSRSLDRL